MVMVDGYRLVYTLQSPRNRTSHIRDGLARVRRGQAGEENRQPWSDTCVRCA